MIKVFFFPFGCYILGVEMNKINKCRNVFWMEGGKLLDKGTLGAWIPKLFWPFVSRLFSSLSSFNFYHKKGWFLIRCQFCAEDPFNMFRGDYHHVLCQGFQNYSPRATGPYQILKTIEYGLHKKLELNSDALLSFNTRWNKTRKRC